MKKAALLFYLMFFAGFVLKFLHIHFNAVIMLIGLGGMMLLIVSSLFDKEKRKQSVFNSALFFWLLQLFVSVKFLPYANILLTVALVLTLIAILISFKKHQLKNLIVLGLISGIAITFYTMPTHTRYFIISIKYNHEIESDFISLDKYSWFLYQNNALNQATEVSDQALEIAKESQRHEWINLIESHNNSIRNKCWKNYRE